MPARLIAIGLLGAACWGAAGCSQDGGMRTSGPRRASLLLGREPSAGWATQIARSDWPSTNGRYEAPEQVLYFEYYRDFQGSFENERNNPYRQFTSYRVGAAQR